MSVQLTPETTAKLDAIAAAYPGAPHPGTVFGVTNKQGEILYLKAVGEKDLSSHAKYETDTVFWIASCTKLVASIAVMQLVEQGKISLDEPLGKIVPELADKDIVVDSDAAGIKTVKAKNAITMRMLLTHTAGFSYFFFNQHITNWQKQNGVTEFSPLNMPLVHEPGTTFEYGVNIDWAGQVLERITGKSLGDYCTENIFGPVGMKDSTFNLTKRPDLKARVPALSAADGDSFKPMPYPIDFEKPSYDSGGAGMLSTVPDYLRLVATLLADGKTPSGQQILKPETIAEMRKPQTLDLPDPGPLALNGVVNTASPEWSISIPLLPGVRKAWGLSHLTNLDAIPGNRSAGSAEWYGISNCNWIADFDQEVGSVIFNAIEPLGDMAFLQTVGQVQGAILAPGATTKQ